MNILVAPDSFKECLSAYEVAKHMEVGIKKSLPGANIISCPMADGGEGTVDTLVSATQGKKVMVKVHDPLMRPINGYFGLLGDNKTAVIEMAAASGLELLSEHERNPLKTTSYGTGELILYALSKGCTKIIIGLGGSATNDGGSGMLQALGVKLLDANNKQVGYGGGELNKVVKIDTSGIDIGLKDCDILVACDVNNPLLGKNGASAVYGAQKGATKKMVEFLESNLSHFSEIIDKQLDKNVSNIPGAGAAGGLGGGLMAFLGAKLKPGFELVSQAAKLEDKIKTADLVITGEGKMDFQTQFGKTPFGVAQLAVKHKVPVIGIAGVVMPDAKILLDKGFNYLFPISEKPISLEKSIKNAPELIQQCTQRAINKYLKGVI